MDVIANLRQQFAHPASRLVLGGRPPEDPAASWFGRVNLALPDQDWPTFQGRPMRPLAQLNLSEAPFVPPALADLALITVFVATDLPLDGAANGRGWVIRAYMERQNLRPLIQPTDLEMGTLRAFPVWYERLDEDLPDWEDAAALVYDAFEEETADTVADGWYDTFGAAGGSKLGGWPDLIQSEMFWAPWNRHPASPEYAFQIDTEEKAGFAWPAGGIAYFGRGTGDARDTWTFSVQFP
ncbi:hypothetical protein GCM10008955_17550 [Deinococcus malanensis]|uniref:DUF1963 domain-containing protein n=1 Tax=Deinococcus malanensis TaxID=1706855 RepID=A0ABQ2ET56_9DEIO|nr:DUF1963 domain-containing protein [Deinococcus malanensis]GGK24450.1 hypothetical protein GCM10008955_17550 [Deinococcus malanensis]